MKCPKCGRVIEDNSIFCEFCGCKIKKAKWPYVLCGCILAVGVVITMVVVDGKEKRLQLTEEELCYSICKSSTEYRDYLNRYPDGRYAVFAANKIKVFENDSIRTMLDMEEAERIAYNDCCSSNSCRLYLQNYPRGNYSSEIQKRLRKFVQDSLASVKEDSDQHPTSDQLSSPTVNVGDFPFNTYYTGKIGSTASMTINRNGDGRYTYDLNGTPISRNIIVKSYNPLTGQLLIDSFDKKGKYIGQFDGYTNNSNSYSGTFTNYKGGKVQFNLHK